ncbi:MAG: single-stranded DNA-binding protein [Muribaculaceae bacterium]|jgi:single-strand DNA-binding protein|nr:single-stranded DNA-binding protein [Muribaculaceae bacterium]
MSVNKVILIGNVGKDPDVRYPSQGHAVATFSLATTERGYTNAQGAQIPERTEWHNIVMWGRHAELAEKYIRKGSMLYIEGKLRTRVWEDKNSIKRYVTEIYVDNFDFLNRRVDSAAPQVPQPQPQQPQNQ